MQEEFKTSLNYIVSLRLTYPGLHEILPQIIKSNFFLKVENWECWCIFLEKTWTCNFLLCTDFVRDFCMSLLGKFREKHFGVCILQLETGLLQLPSVDLQRAICLPLSADTEAHELRNSTNRWLNNPKPFLPDSSNGLRHSHDAWWSPW